MILQTEFEIFLVASPGTEAMLGAEAVKHNFVSLEFIDQGSGALGRRMVKFCYPSPVGGRWPIGRMRDCQQADI
jgi:hypothetical protein